MVLEKIDLENGEKLEFRESPYYFTITIGKKTWYWVRETGKYDGTSLKVAED